MLACLVTSERFGVLMAKASAQVRIFQPCQLLLWNPHPCLFNMYHAFGPQRPLQQGGNSRRGTKGQQKRRPDVAPAASQPSKEQEDTPPLLNDLLEDRIAVDRAVKDRLRQECNVCNA